MIPYQEMEDDPVVIMGLYGEKGRQNSAGPSVKAVIERSDAIVVVCPSNAVLPDKATKYIVGVGNHQGSTKAYLDALRFSREGDTIEVVRVHSGAPEASTPPRMLEKKFEGLFASSHLRAFSGRTCSFSTILQAEGQTLAEALTSHAHAAGAQFLCVGTSRIGTPTHGASLSF